MVQVALQQVTKALKWRFTRGHHSVVYATIYKLNANAQIIIHCGVFTIHCKPPLAFAPFEDEAPAMSSSSVPKEVNLGAAAAASSSMELWMLKFHHFIFKTET